MDIEKSVQVFMPTSLSPWHPSVDITSEAIHSLRRLLQTDITVTVYCDGLPPWASANDLLAYHTYTNQLYELNNVLVWESEKWVGLAGLVKAFISHFELPLMFNMQHDWIIANQETINTPKLIDSMLSHPELQIVRFHKRTLPQPRRYVDRNYKEVDESVYGVPVIATDGWGDSPHFASLKHYHEKVKPNLDLSVGPDGRYGVEGPLSKNYKHRVRRVGFETAQKEWGSFIYGKFGDPGRIEHLGNAARRWRKNKGLEAKR